MNVGILRSRLEHVTRGGRKLRERYSLYAEDEGVESDSVY